MKERFKHIRKFFTQRHRGTEAQSKNTFLRVSVPPCLRVINWGIITIALIALAVLVVLVWLLSETPGRTLYFFFFGPFRTVFSLGNMLNSAIPLILGGLGVSVAMKTGNLNLGGEGQIYSGAFVATIAALSLAPWGFFGGFLAVLAGSFFAGLCHRSKSSLFQGGLER